MGELLYVSYGEVAERPKAAVLKTVGRASAPWVRILLPPPFFFNDFIDNTSE